MRIRLLQDRGPRQPRCRHLPPHTDPRDPLRAGEPDEIFFRDHLTGWEDAIAS